MGVGGRGAEEHGNSKVSLGERIKGTLEGIRGTVMDDKGLKETGKGRREGDLH